MRREVVLRTVIDYMNRYSGANYDIYAELYEESTTARDIILRKVDNILTAWKMRAIWDRDTEALTEITKQQNKLLWLFE